ncbi:uncharacterized protein LOC131324747 isoform X2 [Rhododendron vialii]|uniref:uncharacterized protein LOC131324747 isoform X2 n=1 Tax=Rhododendron vialii TaxID=182163 RepID=UPI00265EE21D|nr:uncharacterized protein LOC131324747 isoform X2 [Rhododendron vialii]
MEEKTSSPSKSINDFDDPYLIHHSDSPTSVLVSPLLTPNNYSTWVRAMRMALRAKNKLGFVTGEIPKPTSPNQLHQWQRCNDLVSSWILHSISPELRGSILYDTSSKEVWDDLHDRFSQPNASMLFKLKREISHLTQENMSVSQYFTRLKTLWDEQSSYIALPACTCGAIKAVSDVYHQDRVLQFLQGLDSSYSNLRSQLLLLEPLPSVQKIYSLIQQEEKQRELHHAPAMVPEAAALIVANRSNSAPKGPNDLQYRSRRPHCNYCDQDGHIEAKCYKKHGYPLNAKKKGSQTRAIGSFVPANESSGGSSSQTHRNNTFAATIEHVAATPLDTNYMQPSAPITQAQYQQILAILSSGPVNEEEDWNGQDA